MAKYWHLLSMDSTLSPFVPDKPAITVVPNRLVINWYTVNSRAALEKTLVSILALFAVVAATVANICAPTRQFA